MPKTRRRSGGPPVGLTREVILRAADTFDVDDLSMPALAAALGVSHAALYYHFPNKQALVGSLAHAALKGVRLDEPANRDWRDLVVEAAYAMHDVLSAHSAYLPHIAASVGAASVTVSERILTAFMSVGCDERQAAEGCELVFAWCIYSAWQGEYFERHEVHTPQEHHAYLDSTGARADSPMRVFVRHYTSHTRDEIFRSNLDAILDGVMRRAGTGRTRPAARGPAREGRSARAEARRPRRPRRPS